MKIFDKSKGAIYVTANALLRDTIPLNMAMQIAKDAGADGFELRRELLSATLQQDEMQNLRAQLEKFSSPSIFSTPQPLFSKGQFEREAVLQVLNEARSLGCSMVKFAPGIMEPDKNQFVALRALLTPWSTEASDVLVTVENGQSETSANIEYWVTLFGLAKSLDCPLWMTFDIGNWTCVGADPVIAAQRLWRFVTYIHAKSVERQGGECLSQPIRETNAQNPVLVHLSIDIPRAIEFPITAVDRNTLTTTLRTYIKWLRSGNFTT